MAAMAPEKPICVFCIRSVRGHRVEREIVGTCEGYPVFKCPCCDSVGPNKTNLMHDQHEAGFNQVPNEAYGFDPLPGEESDS